MKVPIDPHHHQYSVLSVFWIFAILIGLWWYFVVVLICIALMTYDGKQFFNILIHHPYIFFDEVGVELPL